MPYVPTDWVNLTPPPISAANLDKIETGLLDIHTRYDVHDHSPGDPVQVDGGNVINTPAGGIVATDVQAALNELDTEKAGIADVETISGDWTHTGVAIFDALKKGMEIRNAAEFATIQAAITDLGGAKGMVLVPPGTHSILAGITGMSNVSLVGSGMGNTILEKNFAGGTLITLGTRSLIQGITLDGDLRTGDLLAGPGADAAIDRIRFIDWLGTAMVLTKERLKVTRCILDGGASSQAKHDNDQTGIWADVTDTDGITIVGNTFINIHVGACFVSYNHILVAYNYFQDNHKRWNGDAYGGATGGGQLYVRGTLNNANSVVTGNVFGPALTGDSGTGASGIELDAGHVACVGNTIRQQNNYGIVVQSQPNNVVNSNIVSNCTGPAGIILTAGADGSIVMGNRCFDDAGTKLQDFGIEIANGCVDFMVFGNNVVGNLTGGINDNSGAVNKIVDHNLS